MNLNFEEYFESQEIKQQLYCDASAENIEKTKHYLNGLTNESAVAVIILQLLDVSSTDEMLEFCLSWMQERPQFQAEILTRLLRDYPNVKVIDAAKCFLSQQRKFWSADERVKLNIGQLLESYLDVSPGSHSLTLVEEWIDVQPQHVCTASQIQRQLQFDKSIEFGEKIIAQCHLQW